MSNVAHVTTRRILLIALALTALAGCGSKFQTYCQNQADCSGGNDKDVDACVAGIEGQKDVAAAYDCSDAFDKAVACYDSTGHCKAKVYGTDCAAEVKALTECENAASASKQ